MNSWGFCFEKKPSVNYFPNPTQTPALYLENSIFWHSRGLIFDATPCPKLLLRLLRTTEDLCLVMFHLGPHLHPIKILWLGNVSDEDVTFWSGEERRKMKQRQTTLPWNPLSFLRNSWVEKDQVYGILPDTQENPCTNVLCDTTIGHHIMILGIYRDISIKTYNFLKVMHKVRGQKFKMRAWFKLSCFVAEIVCTYTSMDCSFW